MWISSVFATCFGMYITKSVWCLLALFFPVIAFIVMPTISGKSGNTKIEENNLCSNEEEAE